MPNVQIKKSYCDEFSIFCFFEWTLDDIKYSDLECIVLFSVQRRWLNYSSISVICIGNVRTWWDRLACCLTVSVRKDIETQTYDNEAVDVSCSVDDVNKTDIKDVISDENYDANVDSGQTMDIRLGDMHNPGKLSYMQVS
jgi:hypothetical protein